MHKGYWNLFPYYGSTKHHSNGVIIQLMDTKPKNKSNQHLLKELTEEINELEQSAGVFINKKSIFERVLKRRKIQTIINSLTSHRLRQTMMFYFQMPHNYLVISTEKLYALDYLRYVIKNNPTIPYGLYSNSDKKEIDKYLNNKFIIATSNRISKDKVFSDEDLKEQTKYNQIQSKNYHNVALGYFNANGFKSTEFNFTENVIIERCGINYIKSPQKIASSTIIDCGPCEGDSTWQLNQDLKPSLIVSLEPDKENLSKLRRNLKLNKIYNSKILNIGVGNKESFGHMITGIGGASTITKSGYVIKLNSIDNICMENDYGNIGLIKMDIEGSEYPAVLGAEKTIRKYKPVLIIALYHKGRDFFELPGLLKKWVPTYHFRFLNLNKRSATFERYLLAESY